LLVVHASPRSIVDQAGGVHNSMTEVTEAYAGTGAQVIAFGHYHRAFVRTTPFALLINVASVGLPRDGRAVACYTIVTASKDGWVVEQRQVPYDSGDEAAAAAARGMPIWSADPAP
jgi:diadenosine tetraphosphatase ApaH/serine/threonine PP2A family protein phosphatase